MKLNYSFIRDTKVFVVEECKKQISLFNFGNVRKVSASRATTSKRIIKFCNFRKMRD